MEVPDDVIALVIANTDPSILEIVRYGRVCMAWYAATTKLSKWQTVGAKQRLSSPIPLYGQPQLSRLNLVIAGTSKEEVLRFFMNAFEESKCNDEMSCIDH